MNEILHLSMQETYCLPILTYAIAAIKLTVRQADDLNACWNSVYIKFIFPVTFEKSTNSKQYPLYQVIFEPFGIEKHLLNKFEV